MNPQNHYLPIGDKFQRMNAKYVISLVYKRDEQRSVWQQAVEEAGGSSGRIVKGIVEQLKERRQPTTARIFRR